KDKISKAEAQERLGKILESEAATVEINSQVTTKEFVESVFLPFARKRWKPITDAARTDSIKRYIVAPLGNSAVASLKRDELQALLDGLKNMARSMVDHLRWDIKQILDLAVAEGIIPRNPVYSNRMLLFVPRECKKPHQPVMTGYQAKLAYSVLGLRERVILKLAV